MRELIVLGVALILILVLAQCGTRVIMDGICKSRPDAPACVDYRMYG